MSDMRVEVTNAAGMSGDLIRRWEELQRADVRFHSPFARPEFTMAVAAVRPDVEIAVIEESGEVVGFFPYQRTRWNHGKPVGSRMSDFQAVIVAREANWDMLELVRRCRLKSWSFHQLLADQPEVAPYTTDRHEVAYMDLSRGYESYVADRRRQGAQRLKEIPRLRRRAERETGSLQFQLHDEDPAALETLLRWKSAQYQRTGYTDVLSFPWVVGLIRNIVTARRPEFCGHLSTLYIGGQLAAAEISVSSYEVCHGWVTAYNQDLKAFSPGSILMLDLAREQAETGCVRFDLGRNNLPYKASFASAYQPMGSGVVAAGMGERLFQLGLREVTRLSRAPLLAKSVCAAKRVVNPLRGWLAFR